MSDECHDDVIQYTYMLGWHNIPVRFLFFLVFHREAIQFYEGYYDFNWIFFFFFFASAAARSISSNNY